MRHRFRSALPHQLDGPPPGPEHLPWYIERVDVLQAERDCYGEALEQIRDGAYSGDQAAQVAAAALSGSADTGAAPSAPRGPES